MKKGQKTTPEIRLKMSLAKKGKPNGRLGYKHTEETKRRISEKAKLKNFMKGRFGKSAPFYGKRHTEETRLKMSLSLKRSYQNGRVKYWSGKKRPDISVAISTKMTGIPLSENHKKKLSESHLAEKHWNWKGGISNREIHSLNNPRYKKWRQDVFIRDNFTCKLANSNCKKGIQAHHILRWSEYSELRYDINNGITLCHAHHPRKKSEEKRLEKIFIKLASVS
jgi:hypothetical protein